jgi:hypothetical protein
MGVMHWSHYFAMFCSLLCVLMFYAPVRADARVVLLPENSTEPDPDSSRLFSTLLLPLKTLLSLSSSLA